jgi:hypothetical protein
MKAKRDEHAGFQRRSKMTQEERSREAIDYFTGEIKSHAEKCGQQMSGEDARKQAEALANRAERKVKKK